MAGRGRGATLPAWMTQGASRKPAASVLEVALAKPVLLQAQVARLRQAQDR